MSDATPAADGPLGPQIEAALLRGEPTLTRVQVAERAGVDLAEAIDLWHLLGFPHHDDDDVAFTEFDVEALSMSRDLLALGVMDADSQAALVRTWGRSFARLAEWQTSLLAGLAPESPDTGPSLSGDDLVAVSAELIPRLEVLQSYVWRRHLASAAHRLIDNADSPDASRMAVCFVDIVGYTSRSKELDEREFVAWIEFFEDEITRLAVDHGGRIIKTIGDEVLCVCDDVTSAVALALTCTTRGEDEDDEFPRVRAGVAYGDVVSRLGDVFGSTVNVAARLTSLARPGTVLIDAGAHEALEPEIVEGSYRARRLRRTNVKGFSRLESWRLGPAES